MHALCQLAAPPDLLCLLRLLHVLWSPQDATSLAYRLIANYGLSPLGLTTWAPAPRRSNALKERSFEVTGALGCSACLLCALVVRVGRGWSASMASGGRAK